MTIKEFKAWLDGFSEAVGSSPNVKQWKKIQERLADVKDEPEVCRHYHYRDWWPVWYSTPSVPTYTLPNYGTTTTCGTESITLTTNPDSDTTIYNAAYEIGIEEGKDN